MNNIITLEDLFKALMDAYPANDKETDKQTKPTEKPSKETIK